MNTETALRIIAKMAEIDHGEYGIEPDSIVEHELQIEDWRYVECFADSDLPAPRNGIDYLGFQGATLAYMKAMSALKQVSE